MDLRDCRELLGHAEWADALVWRAAEGLDEDGELSARLHHLHAVQWVYLHLWRAEPVVPREPGSFPSRAAIGAWAHEYYRELPSFLAALSEADLARDLRIPWADRLAGRFGRTQPATWAESVLQVALHSTHHRGQVVHRLRELGAEAPLTDFIAWVWLGRPGADWGGDEAA